MLRRFCSPQSTRPCRNCAGPAWLTIGLIAITACGFSLASSAQAPAAAPAGAPTAAPAAAARPAGQQQQGPPPPRFSSVVVRPRVVATTDGEIDDRESMVRFLLYSNEFDVEAIIYNSSVFHWLGHTWSGVEWIQGQIEMYARDYPNLRANADGYPTPEELRSKVFVGNIANVGDMTSDSPGADKIVDLLLDNKPGPLYIQMWGGTNTVARALTIIQRDHPDQIDKVNKKLVLYIILDQDDTFRKYIEPNWPKLQVVGSFRQFGVLAYGWANMMPESKRVFFERPWMEGNITGHFGALTGAYEDNNGAFRSEGDSPSFMYEIPTGLRSLENPGYGGWGGRFVLEKPGVTNVWKEASDDGDMFKPVWRWADAFQNDFAARAQWAVKPYNQVNHAPVVNVEGDLDVKASTQVPVKLSVRGSTDPDGDQLNYTWWQYRDAGTYAGEVRIDGDGSPTAMVTVPADAKPGDTIHVIAEVRDSGKPPLTRYARFILTVGDNAPATATKKGAK